MSRLKVMISVLNISGYLVAELRELVKVADVAVLNVPVKGILSEEDELYSKIKWYDQEELNTLEKLLAAMGDWRPDVYLCGGWAFPIYLQLNNALRKAGCKTVLLADTAWAGKLKQWVNVLLGSFYFPFHFDYAWGAGPPQAKYFKLLGFKKTRIFQGTYCADVNKFEQISSRRKQPWPHNFLYIGRYIAVKNMRRMEQAFLNAIAQMPESNWNLICIGGGELWDERTEHPRIQHLGYKKPAEIQNFIKEAGCFVLPSIYEPWGVVVHEGAVMGMPLLCSSKVNARLKYLREGVNGYIFDPLSIAGMTKSFLAVMKQSDVQLEQMGIASHEIGMSYTPKMWAETVLAFAK